MQGEAKAKFNESVEIAINLGTDPRRGDQQVRGAVVLPHGTGTDTRVAVFAEDEAAELARKAGKALLLLFFDSVLCTQSLIVNGGGEALLLITSSCIRSTRKRRLKAA